ncbi:hypothetical protein ACGYQ5_14385 [Burkholderia pseudomallei]
MTDANAKVDPRAWSNGNVGAIRPRTKSKRKIEPARKFTQAEVNEAVERFLAKRKG